MGAIRSKSGTRNPKGGAARRCRGLGCPQISFPTRWGVRMPFEAMLPAISPEPPAMSHQLSAHSLREVKGRAGPRDQDFCPMMYSTRLLRESQIGPCGSVLRLEYAWVQKPCAIR